MRRLIISLLGLFLAGGVLPVSAATVQDSVTQGNKRRQGRTEERVAPVVDSSLMRLPQAPDRGRNGDTAVVPDVRTAKEDRGMQHIMIDEVVAVIGTKMVKYSDVERALENVRAGGGTVDEKTRCETVESLMVSALYELQADEDSIVVSEAEVENELDGRIKYFVDQIGSREKLEEFYGKSIMQIKEEYREMIRTGIISMRMEAKITEDVRVTPSEVRRYFATLPKDSIPLVPLTFELQYITKNPRISLSEKEVAKNRLSEIRARIEKGERFQSLAALYSQDPGSARKGGDLGYGARGDWASEFESMAFSLPVGELSPIFETQFGFHILEVLDRKGELVHVRHILIRPEASDLDLMRAQKELDSVADRVENGIYTMKEAVGLFSDDAGLQGDGIYINPMTRKPVYTADELDPMVYLAIQDLEEGQNTRALPYQTQDNQPAFRMFYVKKRIPPHRADLETDYDKIYEMALNAAKERTMRDWMRNKIENTYVRIMGRFKDCNFIYRWKSM
ncbi:MAG: peptidylprolyl isomerase [Bacteroidales bacterium]|nr:peptidylprolyl isomerase [Bacteroidales bacterium]